MFSLGMDGALPRFVEMLMEFSYAFAMLLAPLAWLVLVSIRKFRLSREELVLQVVVFVVSWVLTLPLIAILESQNTPGWFLD